MKVQVLRLFAYSMPAKTVVTMPATKLSGEKCPAENASAPPKSVDSIPRYGPSIIPIIGAVIAARVMALLGKPIIGKAGMKEKHVYKAVKHMIKATSLAVSFLPFCMVHNPSA